LVAWNSIGIGMEILLNYYVERTVEPVWREYESGAPSPNFLRWYVKCKLGISEAYHFRHHL